MRKSFTTTRAAIALATAFYIILAAPLIYYLAIK